MAAPARAQITVRNFDRAYSALPPAISLRLQSDDGSMLRTHFTGQVSHVEPLPGSQGKRTAIIHAVSADQQLGQHRIRLPPQVGVRADTVIAKILDIVPLRRSILKGRWRLARADHGELGQNTRLPGLTIPRHLETGQTVLAYVGDTWAAGLPAAAAIRQVVEAERGRFFVNREGEAVFYNRHHLLRVTTPAAALVDNMDGLTYTYGEPVFSRVSVQFRPRRVGGAGTVLWALDTRQKLSPDEAPQTIIARFRDDNERPIGALNLEALVRGLDYTANLAADGSGPDMTEHVEILLRAADFSAAALEVHNRSGQPVYLAAQVRGIPLYQDEPLTVTAPSQYSEVQYGPRELDLDLPALNAVEQADTVARYELARRKTPRGSVTSLTLSHPAHRPLILARTLFDRLTIHETQTNHASDYFIVAEAHKVDRGGAAHTVTWTLESAEANTFWLVGYSRLRRDTVVAY
jgi:hypothetical protein